MASRTVPDLPSVLHCMYCRGRKHIRPHILTQREIDILRLRRQSVSLRDISRQFQISYERVRQIESMANHKIEMTPESRQI